MDNKDEIFGNDPIEQKPEIISDIVDELVDLKEEKEEIQVNVGSSLDDKPEDSLDLDKIEEKDSVAEENTARAKVEPTNTKEASSSFGQQAAAHSQPKEGYQGSINNTAQAGGQGHNQQTQGTAQPQGGYNQHSGYNNQQQPQYRPPAQPYSYNQQVPFYQQNAYIPPQQQSYGGYWQAPPNQQQPINPQQPQSQGNNGEYKWDYNAYEAEENKPKEKKGKGLAVFLIALGLCMVVGISALVIVNYKYADTTTSGGTTIEGGSKGSNVSLPVDEHQSPKTDTTLPEAGEKLTIQQVATKVLPSVVGVMRYESGNLFEPTGLGSGIILSISEEGDAYIISNAHVVLAGSNFKIRVNEGEEFQEFDASLVGIDQRSDLAVLKITAKELGGKELTPAEIGQSENLVIGDPVVAIGNPVSFELSGSVTNGIVSALNRKISTLTTSMSYIQTNAAINPGNSGGALANEYGQVIGINTLKVQAEGFEGIGFAIPMADAIPILEELVKEGAVVSRPTLGILISDYVEIPGSEEKIPSGIYIQGIAPQGEFTPELKKYDIITHVDGERVMTGNDLITYLEDKRIGETVVLTVFRKTSTVSTEEIEIIAELISSGDVEYPTID